MNGEDAGIVAETKFLQYIQGPESFLRNGVGWCPVAKDWQATYVFKDGLCSEGVLLEFLF